MLSLFTRLTEMLSASWWLALLSSFTWGILSIVLSPCHLSTIPLVVAFINDRENITRGRAALLATLFALGILVTLGVIGLVTGLMGRILGDIGGFGNYLVGVFLLLFGIYLLDIVRLPFLENNFKPAVKKQGVITAFLAGLFFGIALGPCAFAFMAPILGIVFSVAADNLLFAIAVLVVFLLGHCLVIILAGTFSQVVRQYLNWNEKSGGIVWLKRICGALIILAAVYFFIMA